MSAPPLILRAGHSHLYPGARGTIGGALPATTTSCLVEFADGSATTGTLAPETGTLLLAASPYVTARGTRIPAKRWRIAVTAGGFRVLRRA